MRGCGGLQQHQERQSCSDLERQNLPVVVNDWHVALVLEGPEGLHLACRDLNWLLEENPTDCFVACWGRQRASVVHILRVRQREEVLYLDKWTYHVSLWSIFTLRGESIMSNLASKSSMNWRFSMRGVSTSLSSSLI